MQVVRSRWWLVATGAAVLAMALVLLLTRLLWIVSNPRPVALVGMGVAAAPSLAYLTRRGRSWIAVAVMFVVAGATAAVIVPVYLPPASVYIDVLRDMGLTERPDARELVANNGRYLHVLDVTSSSRYSAVGLHIITADPKPTFNEIVAAAMKAGFTRVKEPLNDVAHLRRPAHLDRTYSLTVSDVGRGYIEVLLTSDSPETIANQNASLGWG